MTENSRPEQLTNDAFIASEAARSSVNQLGPGDFLQNLEQLIMGTAYVG